jgi:putative ABC transport system ATP-binding protein
MIELRQVTKAYPSGEGQVTAVDQVDLSLPAGDFVALVGPSGCGKSTLLNLVGCLDRPTAGELFIDGVLTSGMDDDGLAHLRNVKLGFVFQHYNLLPRLSAQKNVELPMLYAGVPPKIRAERAAQGLENVGLFGRRHHTPSQLSGGESQRVAVARALVLEPPILVADEPTGNLDSKTGQEIMQMFLDINARGTTILMVTHSPEMAAQAKRIVWARDGKLYDRQADWAAAGSAPVGAFK